jgi:hypothetical protein
MMAVRVVTLALTGGMSGSGVEVARVEQASFVPQ